MADGMTDLRYVGYAVTDFEAERPLYKDVWGLREVASDGHLRRAGEDSDRGVRTVSARENVPLPSEADGIDFDGEPARRFLRFGDQVSMERRLSDGSPLFGAIDQRVVPAH